MRARRAERRRRVMTIAGSDCGGGAGVQADIKTFAAMDVYGTSVLTAITAQNSYGVHAVHELPVEFVDAQIAAIIDDSGLGVDYAKTGMLYSTAIINVVADAFRRYKIPFVLDPVIMAGAGGALLEEDALNTLIEVLLPLCTVVTPNLQDARVISGLEIRTVEEVKEAAIEIQRLGAEAVIIKGGHGHIDRDSAIKIEIAAGTGKATDLLLLHDVVEAGGEGERKFVELSLPLIDIKPGNVLHGAGCSYSAALAVELANGKTLRDAAASAKKFVYNAISDGDAVSDIVVVDQTRGLLKDADRYWTVENVKEAIRMLKKDKYFYELIPEVGTNIGMAISRAENEKDVAAVDGRIVRMKEGIGIGMGMSMTHGCVDFGVSSHVARMILAMMEQDKDRRSAINVRYSQEILAACKESGMKIGSFERDKEPEFELDLEPDERFNTKMRTMEWGVREASNEFIPDVIFDLGAIGKEPMVRIFGNTAVDVAERVNRIAMFVYK